MNEEERELIIRRILVALDASPHSMAALEAAVELAARFRAELLGLFVEDINLLRLAEWPFAREVGLYSATRRRLDVQEVELQLRAQTARIRRIFTTLTERTHVRCAFRVTRGAVASEVLTAASEADILILGKRGLSLTAPGRLGSTARSVLSEAPGLALILQQEARLKLPMLVVYDGSPSGRRVLATALALVEDEEGPLTVLLLADSLDRAQHLQAQVDKWLQERELEVRYRSLIGSDVSKLAHIVQMEKSGTVILPAKGFLLRDEALQTLLDEIEVPVLLVR